MRCVIYLRVSTAEQAERDLTEEGFSIPAQREACVRHIRDLGWDLVDEYSDRGESARSADRPQLQAMLQRITEQRDVDAVVVHKIDRLARNMEDHIAIRAVLRRCGVTLVSVSEKLEETASGRLVEGIHALMAEFYSANLAAEVRKGQSQKAKMGGFPHFAPLGYLNVRETFGGRTVAHVIHDPQRAPLVAAAFEMYATGQYTLERLRDELTYRGLTNRARRDRAPAPLSVSGLANLLTNKFHMGIVEWGGVEYRGTHEPLISAQTFMKVQDLLASRAARGIRERKHHHYLKGLLTCGVCGRRLSIQLSKGRYVYFYCLGQKSRRAPSGCREAYVAADVIERQVEELYRKVELPPAMTERLLADMEAEVVERQARNASEREFLARKLARAETERRRLLDAYYGGAVDLPTLRTEQERIGHDIRAVEGQLQAATAHLEEWQEVLRLAAQIASTCATAYRRASEKTRRLFNNAVFESVLVRDGKAAEARYCEPFDVLFSTRRFEYGDLAGEEGFEPSDGGSKVRCLTTWRLPIARWSEHKRTPLYRTVTRGCLSAGERRRSGRQVHGSLQPVGGHVEKPVRHLQHRYVAHIVQLDILPIGSQSRGGPG